MNSNQRERRRKPRYRVNVKVKANVRLFGSSHPFNFVTENVSESGALLNHDGKFDHFNGSSILEIEIYPSESPSDGQVIRCIGKFVRQDSPKNIGISFTEIEDSELKKLINFIETVSKKSEEA